jgi:hypothetical protein
MANDEESARREARSDFTVNPQTQMLTEQQGDATTRNAYNAELERQRRLAEGNR